MKVRGFSAMVEGFLCTSIVFEDALGWSLSGGEMGYLPPKSGGFGLS